MNSVIQFEALHEGVTEPIRGSVEAAGIDLTFFDPEQESVTLEPGERAVFKTGLKGALQYGLAGMIRPRSKLAVKYGIDVLAGVVDSDYRGEIMVCLINHGSEAVTLNRGERIAQYVVTPVCMAAIAFGTINSETERGGAGINDAQKDLRL